MIDGITLHELMAHLTKQSIIADAEMQLCQRKGWTEISHGSPLFEGLDHLGYLGLHELRFSFWVEPIKPGLWVRVKKSFRYLLGRPEPVATFYPILLSSPGKAGFNVTVIVRRKDEQFVAETTHDSKDTGEIYVTGLSV